MTECSQDPTLELGHGVRAAVRRIDGVPDGVAYWHPHASGVGDCYGYVGFAPKWTNPGWDLLSLSPLTLSPWLLCLACGHHGFIRNGRWVPA